jgi:hypothetical protein
VIKQSEIEIIVSLAVERTIIAISFKENENFLTDLEADLREMLREELTKAGVAVQKKRRARVYYREGRDQAAFRREVERYLPAHFEIVDPKVLEQTAGIPLDDNGLPEHILIEGYDRAGWTLDGYVIPRLGSGLIFAKEVSL